MHSKKFRISYNCARNVIGLLGRLIRLPIHQIHKFERVWTPFWGKYLLSCSIDGINPKELMNFGYKILRNMLISFIKSEDPDRRLENVCTNVKELALELRNHYFEAFEH